MHTTTFRKVGGSMMMTVPPILIEELKANPGDSMLIDVIAGKLVAEPARKPRRSKYTVAQLAANTDFTRTAEDEAWYNDAPMGNELV